MWASQLFKVTPIASVFSPSTILYFNLELLDENKDKFVEHTSTSGKQQIKIKVAKFKKNRIVTLTPYNELICKSCSSSQNFGIPYHYVIACNKGKVEIEDFHVKCLNKFNMGEMDSFVQKTYRDWKRPKLHAAHDVSEITIENNTDTSNKDEIKLESMMPSVTIENMQTFNELQFEMELPTRKDAKDMCFEGNSLVMGCYDEFGKQLSTNKKD